MIEFSFEERAIDEANFIIENNATLREAEKYFGVSRSTIDRDMTRLLAVDNLLAQEALAVLKANKEDSRNRANAARIEMARKKRAVT